MINEKGVTVIIDDVAIAPQNIKDVKIIQEINRISSELPISTCTIAAKNIGELASSTTPGSTIKIYYNAALKMTAFVTEIKKSGQDEWTIEGEDYIGILEDVEWIGDEYFDDKKINAKTLLNNIFAKAGVPAVYESGIFTSSAKNVSGELGITTCRDAALQVCYAAGVMLDTSNSDVLKVRKQTNINAKGVTIVPERIYEAGISTEESTQINNVGIVIYSKRPNSGLDKSVIDSTYIEGATFGQEVEHYFTTPYRNYVLWRVNEAGEEASVPDSAYEILESGLYHVKYKMNVNTELTYFLKANGLGDAPGTTKWYLPQPTSKSAVIDTSTLVVDNNVDAVLKRTYEALTSGGKVSCRIAYRKTKQQRTKYGTVKYGQEITAAQGDVGFELGDVLELDIPRLGKIKRILTKQTFTLGPGILVKECEFA